MQGGEAACPGGTRVCGRDASRWRLQGPSRIVSSVTQENKQMQNSKAAAVASGGPEPVGCTALEVDCSVVLLEDCHSHEAFPKSLAR